MWRCGTLLLLIVIYSPILTYAHVIARLYPQPCSYTPQLLTGVDGLESTIAISNIATPPSVSSLHPACNPYTLSPLSTLILHAPQFPLLPSKLWYFNVTAGLFMIHQSGECDNIEQYNLTGKILMGIGTDVRCSMQDWAVYCARAGCLGVISYLAGPVAGLMAFHDTRDPNRLTVPITQINQDDTDSLSTLYQMSQSNPNMTLVIEMTSGDSNAWEEAFHSLAFAILWRGFLASFAAINILLACHRLIRWIIFVRSRDGHISWIAIGSLCIECVANLIRFVYYCIDPVFSTHQLNYLQARVLLTVSLPLEFISTAVMCFFFQQSIRGKNIKFVSNFKIPLAITSFILIGIDLSASITSGLYIGDALTLVATSAALLVALDILMAILLAVITRRVLNFLKNMANKRSKTNSKGMTEGQISTPTSDFDKRVKSLSRRVLISVCAMLISAVGLAVSALSVKLYPWTWCFATWVGLGFTQVRSLAQIAAFGLPGGRSTQKHLESDIRSDTTNPSTAIYPNSPSGHVSAIQLATPREPHTATLPNSVEISPRGSPSMMSHPSPMILPQPYHHDDNLTPRIPEDGKPMYRDDYIAIAPIQQYSHEPVITPRPQEDAYDLRVVNNQQY